MNASDNIERAAAGQAAAPPPRAAGFRLVPYFSVTVVAALLAFAAALVYFERQESEFFTQAQREQNAFFAQLQDGFAQRHDSAADAFLLRVYEGGNVNLARLFSNALWERDFAPFAAEAQRISADKCRAMPDMSAADGKAGPSREKQECFAGIGRKIMALPQFRALDARVYDTMKKTTVFKMKLFDRRGITVYSSDHGQMGEDKLGNPAWESAIAGKPMSQLSFRGRFTTTEGEVTNRDLVSSYLPVHDPRSGDIVGVFEVYSDVTQFLAQIKSTSAEIRKQIAANQAQFEQAAAASRGRIEANATLLLAVTFGVLALLYLALYLIVRNAQRIIDRQEVARGQSVEALRASEEKYRGIYDSLQDVYVETALDGTILEVSPKVEKLMRGQYRREDLLGKRAGDLYADPARRDVMLRTLKEQGGIVDFEIELRNRDGSVVPCSVSATLAFDAAGVPARIVSTMRDISERRRAERQLADANAQFKALVEQSIAGSYIIQDGKFAYVNPRFAEIFGYGSADDMIGLDPVSVVAEKDRERVATNVRRRIDGETQNISYDFTGLHKDGSAFEVGVHGSRATHRGRPAVIGLIQDISEKKRAEEAIHRYVEELKTAFMSTVQVATTISEMRDPYTAGHERRVAEIAVGIGTELGLEGQRLEGLRVAGYLHDLGKITIPAEILSKPGKLSQVEYKLIQGHSQATYDVLKGVAFPWPVAEVALQHHERMDGTGYPQGLKGDAILLDARIVAVADVVEAMSSHRPYRPALGIEMALDEIERGRGTAYDADVADACLRLFREKGYQLPA